MVGWTIVLLLAAFTIAAIVVVYAEGRMLSAPTHARRLPDGSQEARVIVERGYRPSYIDLEAGIPTTLRFERREDDPCTELLVSELWPNAHRLVAHGETQVRFIPQRPGRYAFTCGMGLYSGVLLVRESEVPA